MSSQSDYTVISHKKSRTMQTQAFFYLFTSCSQSNIITDIWTVDRTNERWWVRQTEKNFQVHYAHLVELNELKKVCNCVFLSPFSDCEHPFMYFVCYIFYIYTLDIITCVCMYGNMNESICLMAFKINPKKKKKNQNNFAAM